MDVTEVKRFMRGPLAPVLTIYGENGGLDLGAVQQNTDQQIRRGLGKGRAMLLAAGAGGDFPLLTTAERKQTITAICQAADGRATVLGCAQSCITAEAIELAQHSQQAGCYAVQVSPPWYYPPNERQMYEYFKAVATSVDIPIMVYNTYWLGANMSIDLIERLADEFPNVRALKWVGQEEVAHVQAYMRLAGKLAMIDNAFQPVQSHLLGATGYVTHLSNVWPELTLKLWDTLEAGDYPAAMQIYRQQWWPFAMLRIWASDTVARGESLLVKRAAELTGFVGGPDRPPMLPMNDAERLRVRRVLEQIGAPIVA